MFKKIYVIDDDQISSFITAVLLETLHITKQIETFNSAEEALQILAQQPITTLPDVIFLDLHMPVVNGWAFLDRLTEQQHGSNKCQVYILTSSVDEEEKAKSRQYPMVADFLHKPLEEEELKQILATSF